MSKNVDKSFLKGVYSSINYDSLCGQRRSDNYIRTPFCRNWIGISLPDS